MQDIDTIIFALLPNLLNRNASLVPCNFSFVFFEVFFLFYILLTVHLVIIFANNQPGAQFFTTYVHFYSLHVSNSYVPIIRRVNCINIPDIPDVVLIQLTLLMMGT